MNTKHKFTFARHTLLTLFALFICLGASLPATAQSTADLLEKGLYTEQTVGDLEAAIEIYTRVVENNQANRPHIAQAQFRLGMCYLKKGNITEARVALDRLIQDFPEQKQLVTQAHEQLAAIQPGLSLAPAPWEDGEFLRYRMSLPTGKELGSLYLMAHSTVVNGAAAWQLELRRFVASQADNYGVSRILVDRDSQRPIRSTLRHGTLGNANATFGPDGIDITGGAVDTHLDSPKETFDNDQSMHLVRMLPLAPGAQFKISFLPLWTAQAIDVGLEVAGTESCKVPAGVFDCFRIEVDLNQTYWLSTGPERYPVKVMAEGVVIELAEIGTFQPESSGPFGLKDFGFSGDLPAGWLVHEYRPPNRKGQAMLRFLDPEAAAISAVEVVRCPRGKCPPLQESSERELAGATKRFEKFELRQGSWSERELDGRPAISFVGDYLRREKPWVQYRLYTFVEDVRLEFIFRTPADRFDELRPTFDAVAESVKAE